MIINKKKEIIVIKNNLFTQFADKKVTFFNLWGHENFVNLTKK